MPNFTHSKNQNLSDGGA